MKSKPMICGMRNKGSQASLPRFPGNMIRTVHRKEIKFASLPGECGTCQSQIFVEIIIKLS